MSHSRPLSRRWLILTDDTQPRGGKKSRRARARIWKEIA